MKHKVIWTLQRAQADIQKRVEQTQKNIWAARSKRDQERFNVPKSGDRQMRKALKKAPGQPLVFVMQEDDQVTADPEVADRQAREAWAKVYQGMPGTQE